MIPADYTPSTAQGHIVFFTQTQLLLLFPLEIVPCADKDFISNNIFTYFQPLYINIVTTTLKSSR